jgi:hypothetical protein
MQVQVHDIYAVAIAQEVKKKKKVAGPVQILYSPEGSSMPR